MLSSRNRKSRLQGTCTYARSGKEILADVLLRSGLRVEELVRREGNARIKTPEDKDTFGDKKKLELKISRWSPGRFSRPMK